MRLRAGAIAIRRVRDDDFQEIMALLRQLPGGIRLWTEDSLAQAFQGLLAGESQEAFVATLNQRVIGFISLYYMRVLHCGGTVANIQEWVVTEELRGRGIGRALIDFAVTRARESCCSGINLACGLPRFGGRLPSRAAGIDLDHRLASTT